MLQVRLGQVSDLLRVVRFMPPTRVEGSNALLGHAKDVRSWIESCDLCNRRKTPRPNRAGLPGSLTVSSPAHTWAIDILGPFPETTNGNVYVLTMIDVFTRWLIAVPLRPNLWIRCAQVSYRRARCNGIIERLKLRIVVVHYHA